MTDRMKAGCLMLLFLAFMSATMTMLFLGARYHDNQLLMLAGLAYILSHIPGGAILLLIHRTEPDE